MSEVYIARNFDDWSKTLPNVGREGLVGVALYVDRVEPVDHAGIFRKAAIEVARNDIFPEIDSDEPFRSRFLTFSSPKITGAHVDMGEIPPRTLWAHTTGRSTWTMFDTGTIDIDGIGEAFDRTTVSVSSETAQHGQIFSAEALKKCVIVEFVGPAIFCAATGSDTASGLAPAIHQVEPGIEPRADFALNSLIFKKHGTIF